MNVRSYSLAQVARIALALTVSVARAISTGRAAIIAPKEASIGGAPKREQGEGAWARQGLRMASSAWSWRRRSTSSLTMYDASDFYLVGNTTDR